MSAEPVATTVGPVRPETRDRVKSFRDEHGLSNYEEALQALLEEVEA